MESNVDTISYVRHKHNEAKSMDELREIVDEVIDGKHASISSISVKRNIATGLWLTEHKLIQITANRNIPNYMGFTRDSVKYLDPIEALFLMESESLEVLCQQIPLSVEEAFSLLLSSSRQLDVYRVYAHLSRNGYAVKLRSNKRTVDELKLDVKPDVKRKLSMDCDYATKLNKQNNDIVTDFDEKLCMTNIRPLTKQMLTKKPHNSSKHMLNNDSDDPNNLSIVYDLKRVNDSECEQLSNPLLNGSVKPLLGCSDTILSNDELFGLLQSHGPQCVSSAIDSVNDLEFDLDAYKSGKRLSECPLFHVIVTNTKQSVPCFDAIFHLKSKAKAENICFAVVDDNVNFYSISSFNLNDEFPTLWQKHL